MITFTYSTLTTRNHFDGGINSHWAAHGHGHHQDQEGWRTIRQKLECLIQGNHKTMLTPRPRHAKSRSECHWWSLFAFASLLAIVHFFICLFLDWWWKHLFANGWLANPGLGGGIESYNLYLSLTYNPTLTPPFAFYSWVNEQEATGFEPAWAQRTIKHKTI